MNTLRSIKARAERLLVAPWFIPTLAIVAVVALCLSTYSVLRLALDARAREDQRIVADVAGCERGNELRAQTIGVGRAGSRLVAGVVGEVADFASLDADERRVLEESLAPLFDEYRAEIDAIETTDCQTAVPGTTPRRNP